MSVIYQCIGVSGKAQLDFIKAIFKDTQRWAGFSWENKGMEQTHESLHLFETSQL